MAISGTPIGEPHDTESTGDFGGIISLLKRLRRIGGANDAITAGTKSTTTTAALLSATSVPCVEILIQSIPTNVTNVLVGDANSQPVVLIPGAFVVVPASNANLIYVKAASGTPSVAFLTRN